jgi:hypothetical protein
MFAEEVKQVGDIERLGGAFQLPIERGPKRQKREDSGFESSAR